MFCFLPQHSFNVTVFLSRPAPFSLTFSSPGNVFCRDELLMSVVEGSVVSENKRVTLSLLSFPLHLIVNLNRRSNEPRRFLAALEVVIIKKKSCWVFILFTNLLLNKYNAAPLGSPCFPLALPYRGKGSRSGKERQKRGLTPLVSFEW